MYSASADDEAMTPPAACSARLLPARCRSFALPADPPLKYDRTTLALALPSAKKSQRYDTRMNRQKIAMRYLKAERRK